MAEQQQQQHNRGVSLSPTSDNDSSDHHTGGGPSGGSSSHRIPPSPTDHHLLPAITPPPHKKPRGRPPGSKNKPKPPVVITRENEDSMKPVIIEITPGSDVVDTLINFARRRHVSISILSATGTVANVTLRHPVPHAPTFTLHGPFTMLSLTGSYVYGTFTPSTSSVVPLIASASSSSSSSPGSAFGITLAGAQGQIFGGIVGGKVVASNGVFVVASIFKKHLFQKVGDNGNGDEEDGENNNDDKNGENNESMSGFNVASPVPLNCQAPSEVNVMQWGHSHSSSRAANY